MPKIKFVNEKQEIEVPEGANLRLEAMKAGIQVYENIHKLLNCRGLGLCGTCKVLVKSGKEHLSAKTGIERFTLARMLSTIGHEDDMRLSCQCKVQGDCEIITRPGFNWSGENFWQKPYPNK
jgi:ferredoxin